MRNIIAALLLTTSFSLVAEESDNRKFLSKDIFELEIAGDPRISPDGSQVAYVRQSMDIMTDQVRANVWVVGTDGRGHRPLLSGTDSFSSPRWSPSGDRLAYVASAGERGPELYVRWMDTGQTALLSNLPADPDDIAWSPDGKQIAFTMFAGTAGPKLATPPAMPEGAEWAPPVIFIDKLYYRTDGLGYIEPGNTHAYVIPADGGTPRQITSGDFNHSGRLSWSPDGDRIALTGNRDDDWEFNPENTELWSVDVASGDMQRLTERFGPDESATYSPDGSKIAFIGFDDKKLGYHNWNVYVMDVRDGSTLELTTDFDRSVDGVSWAGSSNRLYIQYDDSGRRHIATLSMNGNIESIADDVSGTEVGRPYTSGGFSVADNGAYAYSAGGPERPADIAAGRRGGAASRLTSLNDDLLAHKILASVEEITWQSSVGDYELQGWLVTPPGFDPEKKYPLILEIHGGPASAYGPHFTTDIQLYAAAGYVVLYTNPRGSTSYGDQFANEIQHNYPGQDYDDLMSGVDAVNSRGFIDEDQLFVTGGSGGGVLTTWIVGKTDRFAAAVAVNPVINWTSMTLYSDLHWFIPEYWFAKPPWEDPESYWVRSPLSLVGNVTTPTMLLTGESDLRTPMPESEQYYQALQLRKIDSALVRVPEASHGIEARPSHLIAKADNILAWFARYRTDSE